MENRHNLIRILVVDDEPDWRRLLSMILRRHLGKAVQVTAVKDYDKARSAMLRQSYDLVSLDLKLSPDEFVGSYSGRALLESIRKESKAPNCGLIVLSGYGTEDIAIESLRDYEVDDYIKKPEVNFDDPKRYVNAVKRALRRSLLNRAAAEINSRTLLTLSFNRQELKDGELRIPGRVTKIHASPRTSLNVTRLSDVADDIGQKIIYGRKGVWRSIAKRIGQDLYQFLKDSPAIYDLFVLGREHVITSSGTLHLQFSGPLQNVKLPFELMYEEDYLVFNHIITRGLSEGARNSERFHEFISSLCRKEKSGKQNANPLQAVVVGANVHATTPRCEEEARAVAKSIKRNLELLDIPVNVKLLVGRKDATYANLEANLRDGCHIFHFAGHANYVKSVPDKSVIYLYDKEVSATSMKSLLRRRDVRFAFLSCCLGAHVGSGTGRGDFYGFLDALSKTGVQAILGYRWPVNDYSAGLLAEQFYENLFRNFCPAQSLYLARDRAASKIGRDEDVWASPILLMQNY
ncbi:MAG: CHAT domain-containing protein [Acidobacteria bacterium]|nr:CHAT domain-containing protein [Acidobacteriota bacterium]